MKRLLSLSICLVAAGLLASLSLAEDREADKPTLVGTWERVGVPKKYRQVKTYSERHFNWIAHESAGGRVVSVGGGTYTFDGETLKEKVEFGSENVLPYVGAEPGTYAIKFEGEGWTQDGKTPLGAEISEVYRRAK